MDKVTLNLFVAHNKLQEFEKICYAAKKDAFNDIEDFTMFYKVITVNCKTGEVRKYTHYGHITNNEPWHFQIMN